MSESDGVADDVAVRRLLRRADRATLATVMPDGTPYASLVLGAVDHDGAPLLLLSDLAQHTRNMAGQAAVSLLYDATGGGGVASLAGTRVTVLGTAAPSDDPRHRARFLARHPGYADFADFRCWRVAITRAHLIAGFGRIRWIDHVLLDAASIRGIVAAEAGVVDHMNADHADALDLYATALAGCEGRGWRMAGIDPDGLDLRHADRHVRLDFAKPVHDSSTARAELVRLAAAARECVRHAAC